MQSEKNPDEAVVALLMLELIHRQWFGGMFKREARRYMPSLLASVSLWSKVGRPLSTIEAYDAMQAAHGKTGAHYVREAESLGLVRREASSDARRVNLVATNELDELMAQEGRSLVHLLKDALDASARENVGAQNNRHRRMVSEIIPELAKHDEVGWTQLAGAIAGVEFSTR